jgi:hypothetical protein
MPAPVTEDGTLIMLVGVASAMLGGLASLWSP